MEKRFHFKCWNCERQYSLFLTLDGKPTLAVECPYCHQEASAPLAPYVKRPDNVLRGPEATSKIDIASLELPEVLPTTKPDDK